MHTYSCSGTLGDVYITLCILYHIATKGPVICRHYTTAEHWHGLIRQIYSLLPNVTIEFVKQREMLFPRIHSTFVGQQQHGDVLFSPDDWCVFPRFSFPELISLPKDYIVLNPQSGSNHQGRILKQKTIDHVIKVAQYPIIIIGNNEAAERIVGDNVINLTNRTSLLEAMGVVSKARQMITFQGVMSMVSLSHKIPSDIHICRPEDRVFVTHRVAPEWKQYCNIVENEHE